LPIMVRISLTPSYKHLPTCTQTRKIDEASIAKFKSRLDWSSVLTLCCNDNPNVAYDEFFSLFKAAYNTAFPLVSKTASNRNKFKNPWMTTGLLKSSKKRKNYI